MEEELDAVLTKITDRTAAGHDKIHPDVWKTRKFDDILLQLCNTVYKQSLVEKWTKGYILLSLQKSDLGITKYYSKDALPGLN